jgi:hypothetical protein
VEKFTSETTAVVQNTQLTAAKTPNRSSTTIIRYCTVLGVFDFAPLLIDFILPVHSQINLLSHLMDLQTSTITLNFASFPVVIL